MKVNVTIDIGRTPVTADDWELFTNSMNCDEAAQALTAALEEAIKACAEGKGVFESLNTYFYPVTRKYADYGASDSEPLGKAEWILNRVKTMTTPRSVR